MVEMLKVYSWRIGKELVSSDSCPENESWLSFPQKNFTLSNFVFNFFQEIDSSDFIQVKEVTKEKTRKAKKMRKTGQGGLMCRILGFRILYTVV